MEDEITKKMKLLRKYADENPDVKALLGNVILDFPDMFLCPNNVTASECLRYNDMVRSFIKEAELQEKLMIQ